MKTGTGVEAAEFVGTSTKCRYASVCSEFEKALGGRCESESASLDRHGGGPKNVLGESVGSILRERGK